MTVNRRIVRNSWTPREDKRLLEIVAEHGNVKDWSTVAQRMLDYSKKKRSQTACSARYYKLQKERMVKYLKANKTVSNVELAKPEVELSQPVEETAIPEEVLAATETEEFDVIKLPGIKLIYKVGTSFELKVNL